MSAKQGKYVDLDTSSSSSSSESSVASSTLSSDNEDDNIRNHGNIVLRILKNKQNNNNVSDEEEVTTCPSFYLDSDALVEASYDIWSTDSAGQSKLVYDAVTAWDTQLIIGACHNELAISPQDNQTAGKLQTTTTKLQISGHKQTINVKQQVNGKASSRQQQQLTRKQAPRPVTGPPGASRSLHLFNQPSLRPDFVFRHQHEDTSVYIRQYRNHHTVANTGMVHYEIPSSPDDTSSPADSPLCHPDSRELVIRLRQCSSAVDAHKDEPPGSEDVFQPASKTPRGISNVSAHYISTKPPGRDICPPSSAADENNIVSGSVNSLNSRYDSLTHTLNYRPPGISSTPHFSRRQPLSAVKNNNISVDTPPEKPKKLTNPLGEGGMRKLNLAPVRDSILSTSSSDSGSNFTSPTRCYHHQQLTNEYRSHMNMSTSRNTFQQSSGSSSSNSPVAPLSNRANSFVSFVRTASASSKSQCMNGPDSSTSTASSGLRPPLLTHSRTGSASSLRATAQHASIMLGKTSWRPGAAAAAERGKNELMVKPSNFGTVAQLLSYVHNTSPQSNARSPMICSRNTLKSNKSS